MASGPLAVTATSCLRLAGSQSQGVASLTASVARRTLIVWRDLALALKWPLERLELALRTLERRLEALEQRSEDVVRQDYTHGLSPNQVLGSLCSQHHEWQETGQSRRYRNNNRCVDCANQAKREKRAARKW